MAEGTRVLRPIPVLVVFSLCVVAFIAWASLQGSDKNSCSVPNVRGELQDALCSGDAKRLRKALFDVAANSAQPRTAQELGALRRVYVHEQQFGSHLPWEKLSTLEVQAVLIDELSQAVRNGELDMSLVDMQGVAKQVLVSKSEVDQWDGLRLLGLTDDTASIPMLRQIAMSGGELPVRRESAIEALGYICDPAAKAVLDDLVTATAGVQLYSRYVQKALAYRAGLDRSWCRKSSGQVY